METCEIAVIGAGKTGRGFIGRLLGEEGRSFLFIDRDEGLISRLEERGSYTVKFFGAAREPFPVKGFKAVNTASDSLTDLFRELKLVFISVGGNNLKDLARQLAPLLEERLKVTDRELSFILCENAVKPAHMLETELLALLKSQYREKALKLFGFSEATVFCTTLEDEADPLDILSENYPYLQCDARGLKGEIPKIKGLKPIEGFDNFLLRKLYTYNCASAVIAYLGWWKGYTEYPEAANDRDILSFLEMTYDQVGKALCKTYGYSEEDQREFAELSLRKFRDRSIRDTVERNAREPHRKLKARERIIGPIRLVSDTGGDAAPLLLTAAAAILYHDPEDSQWSRIQRELGARGILRDICGLDPDEAPGAQIMEYYSRMKEGHLKPSMLGQLLSPGEKAVRAKGV